MKISKLMFKNVFFILLTMFSICALNGCVLQQNSQQITSNVINGDVSETIENNNAESLSSSSDEDDYQAEESDYVLELDETRYSGMIYNLHVKNLLQKNEKNLCSIDNLVYNIYDYRSGISDDTPRYLNLPEIGVYLEINATLECDDSLIGTEYLNNIGCKLVYEDENGLQKKKIAHFVCDNAISSGKNECYCMIELPYVEIKKENCNLSLDIY